MAYNDECAAAKKSCQRLLVFSTPLVRWSNEKLGFKNIPLGTALEAPNAAYNTEQLCRNAAAVSRYR
jgi:hypothetical protein